MKKLSCTFWLFFLSASFSFAQHDTAVIKTNVEVPDMLVQKIREAVKASKAFQFTYLP